MNENQWTQSICDILNSCTLGENIHVTTFCKLPYAFEIDSYDALWQEVSTHSTLFETDMMIYEERGEKRIPRVIVEAKFGSVTTHDAITYSNKAMYHKQVMPYLRYGIMLGDRGTYPLPGRLFRHGTHFDFLFSFSQSEPSDKEIQAFIEMIRKEIHYSQQWEEILTNNRRKNRKHYYLLQKELHLDEFE